MDSDVALSSGLAFPTIPDHVLDFARRIVKTNRSRRGLFGVEEGFFGDPAWDILLELFAAGSTPKLLQRSELSISNALSEAVLNRYLRALAAAKLVELVYPEEGGYPIAVLLTQLAYQNIARAIKVSENSRTANEFNRKCVCRRVDRSGAAICADNPIECTV